VLLLVTIGFVAWQYELRLDAENTQNSRNLSFPLGERIEMNKL
jgi:hypothetical protein